MVTLKVTRDTKMISFFSEQRSWPPTLARLGRDTESSTRSRKERRDFVPLVSPRKTMEESGLFLGFPLLRQHLGAQPSACIVT